MQLYSKHTYVEEAVANPAKKKIPRSKACTKPVVSFPIFNPSLEVSNF